MSALPQPRPHLATLKSYHAGLGDDKRSPKIRLAYNEGAFGASPKAVAAYQEASTNLSVYPDMCYGALRRAIAAAEGIDPLRVVCGAGSDELIGLLANAYAGPGDEAIHTQYGFAVYPVVIKASGAATVCVPEKDLQYTVDDILRAVTQRTKLIFLANPNNPTGHWLNKSDVHRLAKALPSHALLVYDAAYNDFVSESEHESGNDLVGQFPNVVVLRTFSKIHALAALRVGWAYGSADIIDVLNRVRNPFNVAGPAAAAAIASLSDADHIRTVREHVIVWREKLYRELVARSSFKVYPSQGNFLLVGVGSAERAQSLLNYLKTRDIQIRPMVSYHLPDHVRISIGREDEMLALLAALNQWLASSP